MQYWKDDFKALGSGETTIDEQRGRSKLSVKRSVEKCKLCVFPLSFALIRFPLDIGLGYGKWRFVLRSFMVLRLEIALPGSKWRIHPSSLYPLQFEPRSEFASLHEDLYRESFNNFPRQVTLQDTNF